jgi:hypothetical protein
MILGDTPGRRQWIGPDTATPGSAPGRSVLRDVGELLTISSVLWRSEWFDAARLARRHHPRRDGRCRRRAKLPDTFA